MKKSLLTFIAFMSLISTTFAEKYYFFERMPYVKTSGSLDLNLPGTDSGSSEGEQQVNPNLSISTVSEVDMTTEDTGSTVAITLNSETISDFTSATLTATSGDESIVTSVISGSEASWTLNLTKVAATSSNTNIRLIANVGKETAILTIPVNIIAGTSSEPTLIPVTADMFRANNSWYSWTPDQALVRDQYYWTPFNDPSYIAIKLPEAKTVRRFEFSHAPSDSITGLQLFVDGVLHEEFAIDRSKNENSLTCTAFDCWSYSTFDLNKPVTGKIFTVKRIGGGIFKVDYFALYE